MRTLILILILAGGFGGAALWQRARVERLREERALEAELQAGLVAETASGILGRDEAVVVIGRPAGVAPVAAQPDDEHKKNAEPTPVAPPPPGDFVVEVRAGQSLSKIAHAHYGHAPLALVTKLAAYNGMADADELRAGMMLKLPTLERLGVVLKD